MFKFQFLLFVWALKCTHISCYFNCENGVYESMYQIVKDCQETSYAPNLRTFRKTESTISGPSIVEMLEDYCSISERIFRCGKDLVQFIPCLLDHVHEYETLINKSHWLCQGAKLKEAVFSIFKTLPVETLDYNANGCYRLAPAKTYDCLRKYLESVSRKTERKETTRRILASFRCSFRKMAKECPRSTSLLLTTMEYDWLIIPPVFGFNISDVLIAASLLKVK